MPKFENRTCGECTVCCKTHLVNELNKPAGTWCGYCEQGHGCSIYSKRPQGCRDFACAWLKGYGEDKDRPNLSQIVIDYYDIGLQEPIVTIWEAEERALELPSTIKAMNRILSADIFIGLIYLSGKEELIVPEGKQLSSDDERKLREGGCKILYATEVQPNAPT